MEAFASILSSRACCIYFSLFCLLMEESQCDLPIANCQINLGLTAGKFKQYNCSAICHHYSLKLYKKCIWIKEISNFVWDSPRKRNSVQLEGLLELKRDFSKIGIRQESRVTGLRGHLRSFICLHAVTSKGQKAPIQACRHKKSSPKFKICD